MFWKYNWPALVWAFFILILCGFPGNRIPELTFLQWLKPDKFVHVIIFGVQSFLLLRGFQKHEKESAFKNASAWAIVLTIIYGASVEVMQEYIFFHRSGDVRDAIANALGAFAGLWIYRKYYSKFLSKTY